MNVSVAVHLPFGHGTLTIDGRRSTFCDRVVAWCAPIALERVSTVRARARKRSRENDLRALEARYGLGMIRQLLSDAIDEGTLAPQPVDALAHILLAAVDEAALFIANAPKPRVARDASARSMRSLLAGVTGDPPS